MPLTIPEGILADFQEELNRIVERLTAAPDVVATALAGQGYTFLVLTEDVQQSLRGSRSSKDRPGF
jgi:hypothetical protein